MKIHFAFGAITFASLAVTAAMQMRPEFGFDQVRGKAQALAAQPYRPAAHPIPDSLRQLNYDQLRDIRWNNEHSIWRDAGLPFQLRFFHLGRGFDVPVHIATVDGMDVEPIAYSPDLFDYGKNKLPPLPRDLGFAGFRVHYPLNRPDVMDEVIVFQGASYFRALAADTVYGLSARGVAVNTCVPKQKEEFPAFTNFWIKRPGLGSSQLVLYALLEGKRLTGAYQFTVTPGEETRVDVRAELFVREDIEQLGIAPLTTMFWFGENQPHPMDYRPEVHDSDGLLIESEQAGWHWRPLANGRDLDINTFSETGVRGFGLLQRDRDFDHYADLEAKYHRRPSVWIQPHGDWGPGKVLLMTIPTADEYQDNVVAFWTPDRTVKKGEHLVYEYTMHWAKEDAGRPPIGRTVDTRIQRPHPGTDAAHPSQPLRFVLEFDGGELDGLGENDFVADIVSDPPGAVVEQHLLRNEEQGTWRVSFAIDDKLKDKTLELRCRLADAGGRPLTETWSYTWRP